MKRNELKTIESESESERVEKINGGRLSSDRILNRVSARESRLDDFDPKQGFATRFYGANECFIGRVESDIDLFGNFANDLKNRLTTNKKSIAAFKDELKNTSIIDSEHYRRLENTFYQDAENQTDMHYRNMKVKNFQIILNEKIISFQEREKNQLERRFLENRRPDYEQSSHMNFTLFLEYLSNDSSSPYLEIQKNNIVKFNPIAEQKRVSLSHLKPCYYNFDNVVESSVQNDIASMINHTIQKVNDERDVVVVIYGNKRTGKRKLKNQIVTSIFKYFEKVLLETNINEFNFNFSAFLKDTDTRFSDLTLKPDSYQEQLLNLLNSLFKKPDKRFLKDKIGNTNFNTKCAFFELSRIIDDDYFNSEFLKSVCTKVSGLYVITINQLVKQKNNSKKSFIKSVLRDALSENKDTLLEEPLQRLLKNFENLYTKVICTINPSAPASRHSYNLIQTLPTYNKYYD